MLRSKSKICVFREAALRNAKSKPLLSGRTYQPQAREKYPFVFDQYEQARHSSAYVSGSKVRNLSFVNGDLVYGC